MTNSQVSPRKSLNGSTASEVVIPPAERPGGVRALVQSPAWMRLSRGMAIRAVIEAKVMGRRLLTLDADIAILPARADREGSTRTTRSRPPGQLPAAAPDRRPGAALLEAAESLKSVAADLEAARRQTP